MEGKKMETKKRLIDANALKEKAEPEEVTGEGIVYVQDIDEAPTVDAVEVVRCKDCKWFADNNGGEWFGCALFNSIRAVPDDAPKDNDFCSWGERKDNG
jgi:hypothetical protein